MAKKEFIFKGKKVEELKQLSIEEFSQLVTSRQRRSLKRGFTEAQKSLMKKIQKNAKNIETHCRDMVIIPEMLGMTIKVHSGKEFVPILIQPEMLGHFLGEFVMTRKRVAHSSPGVGATRSSSAISVK